MCSRLFSRGYFVALNLCLIILGVLRAAFLLGHAASDPYNLHLSWPRTAGYLLLDTGFPCLTTAFAVLFLALLRATQIELVSPGFQTPRALGAFCAVHLAVSVAVDVAVGLFVQVRWAVFCV